MVVTIGNRSNTYYLFGGRDESSYTLIQGITLAGVLFDEVALMPRSFVEQAMARCSVSVSLTEISCSVILLSAPPFQSSPMCDARPPHSAM